MLRAAGATIPFITERGGYGSWLSPGRLLGRSRVRLYHRHPEERGIESLAVAVSLLSQGRHPAAIVACLPHKSRTLPPARNSRTRFHAMTSQLSPDSVDVLLFDIGRVVLDINFEKVMAHWA